jgi:uncharacterized phage infection (PIP) family protein YhgE
MTRQGISVIWSGEESDYMHQIDYLIREASLNHINRLRWKDKTPHERLCQYVGKPMDTESRFTLRSKWGDNKKHQLLELQTRTKDFLLGLVGKEFDYIVSKQESVKVENAFAKIANGGNVYYQNCREFNKVEELEKYVEELNSTAESNVKYILDISEHRKHKGCFSGEINRNEEHQAVFKPWAMLEDDAVLNAWNDLTAKHGLDDRELCQREIAAIDNYNTANNAVGRQRRPYNKEKFESLPAEIQEWMNKRDQAENELSMVRSELGKIKRKITNLTKKSGGLELDLTKYCFTNTSN